MVSPESFNHESFNQFTASVDERLAKAREKTLSSGDPSAEEALLTELETETAKWEQKINPFEAMIGLKEQYETQVRLLKDAHLLETLSSGEEGIKGPDGAEYPLPTLSEVIERLLKQSERLMPKVEQGFKKLQLVPFALRTNKLADAYAAALKVKHARGELKYSDGAVIPPDKFDPGNPVWRFNQYDTDKARYFPDEFAPGKGLEHQEAILKFGGWQIELIEDLPTLPRWGQGETVPKGCRPQLESNQTPRTYLELLKQDPYKEEIGITEKSWLIQALARLESSGQVLNDWQNPKDTASWLLGVHFPAFGYVGNASWFRRDRQAGVYANVAGQSDGNYGVSSAVRVEA